MVFDAAEFLGKHTFEIEECYTLEQIMLLSFYKHKDRIKQMVSQANILVKKAGST